MTTPSAPPPEPTTPSAPVAPPAKKPTLLIALGIASALLLAATIVLGVNIARVLGAQTGAEALPSPSPSTTPSEPVTVQGRELTVAADAVSFDHWTMTDIDSGESHTVLYATVTNTSATTAVTAYFDASAYDDDDRIVDRSPTYAYLLPGQTSLVSAIFTGDITSATSFLIEQTRAEVQPVSDPGEVTASAITAGEYGLLSATITSTLPPELTGEVFLAWLDGDEIRGLCEAAFDIPVGDSTAECYADPVGANTPPADVDAIPDGSTLVAYATLDIPY
ncbi:hypothetical protein [Streptomyces sp. AC495_CC817]|uniref:hypothetical protein n=1 Tax=Streptomyces sp. AC495_CC817 TaxID=2823900 RepID=UPI001C265E18|nr:hypothetical protein [Streptomyces sp. AC495_CC817]